MRNRVLMIWTIIFFASSAAFALNRIEGTVFDPDRHPIENVFVELRNELDSPISQNKTNSSGRFTFIGMSNGRYSVRALPLRTNFAEQSQEVTVASIRTNGSDIAYVEIYLTYRKDSSEAAGEKAAEAIFVQEIPPAAKKLYENGAADLKANPEKGFAELEESLKIFPNYFDALSLLGKTYILRTEYEKAYPYLLRAIDVNSRSFSSYYRLGYIFLQMKQYAAALKAAQAAVVLNAGSADAQLLYGTVLRITGNLPEAQKTLLKANSLTKGKNAETHLQLALLYNKLNQNQSAINELETYLKIEPDSPDKAKIQEIIAKIQESIAKSKSSENK